MGAGRAINTATRIPIGWTHAVVDRPGAQLEFPDKFLGNRTTTHQIARLLPDLERTWRS